VRNPSSILLFCAGCTLLACPSEAQVLQSTSQNGLVWTAREGAETRIHLASGEDIRVELPPGASIRDLEPTTDGWMAAGRLPTGRGSDLLILVDEGDGADLLPVPEGSGARYRGQPVLFLEDGRFVGLAWTEGEGPREFEIWAADWQDGQWGLAQRVSPKGPGSQVAPSGSVLEDGSRLLVWAAFDGEDDEILWSQQRGGRWTPPRRIHLENDVPDLMPAIVSTESGALVVWSWFDGNDYRLKSARWVDGAWLESGAFGGKGSGNVGLIESDDGILLLYQSVKPAEWTVLDLDLSGIPRRVAGVMEESNERPLVVVEDEGETLLRWLQGDRRLEWRDLP